MKNKGCRLRASGRERIRDLQTHDLRLCRSAIAMPSHSMANEKNPSVI